MKPCETKEMPYAPLGSGAACRQPDPGRWIIWHEQIDHVSVVGSALALEQHQRQLCAIVLEEGRLKVRSQQPQAGGFFGAGPSRELIPIDAHSFYAGIAPVLISSVEDIREMRVDSTQLGGGGLRVWTRY